MRTLNAAGGIQITASHNPAPWNGLKLFGPDGAVLTAAQGAEVRALFDLPFPDLIYQAQTVHRAYFDPTEIQVSTLLSIKTGGCPEDCAYCPQSAKFDTGVKAEKLMDVDEVLSEARAAKEAGARRF